MTPEAVRASVPGRSKETFDDFFDDHFERVTRFVSNRLANPSDVEDVVARTFIDAHRGWRKCRGDRGLWILAIARRRVADVWRRKHAEMPLREDMALESKFDHADLIAARQAVDSLPDIEREVILMQTIDGLAIRDIAAVIGRTEAATNSLLERAKRRLRQTEVNP